MGSICVICCVHFDKLSTPAAGLSAPSTKWLHTCGSKAAHHIDGHTHMLVYVSVSLLTFAWYRQIAERNLHVPSVCSSLVAFV
jgi:hypothetical protein